MVIRNVLAILVALAFADSSYAATIIFITWDNALLLSNIIVLLHYLILPLTVYLLLSQERFPRFAIGLAVLELAYLWSVKFNPFAIFTPLSFVHVFGILLTVCPLLAALALYQKKAK